MEVVQDKLVSLWLLGQSLYFLQCPPGSLADAGLSHKAQRAVLGPLPGPGRRGDVRPDRVQQAVLVRLHGQGRGLGLPQP